MAGIDKLIIEILEDGTIKTTTDKISGANHANAEQFLKHLATLAGGETSRVRRSDVQSHTHTNTKQGDTEHDSH
jgi:hypothetical protein